jgi:hypothetical protein
VRVDPHPGRGAAIGDTEPARPRDITTTIGKYGHIDRRSAAAAASAMSRALTLALPQVLEQRALPAGRPQAAAGA